MNDLLLVADSMQSFLGTFGVGALMGLVMAFALRKVIVWVVKGAAIILGLFFFGMLYLQTQHLADVHWDSIENRVAGFVHDMAKKTANGEYTNPLWGVINSLGAPLSVGLASGLFGGAYLKK